MFTAHSFRNKSVAVFGLARSGISCAQALKRGGSRVYAWDDSEPSVAKAAGEGIAITNLHDVDFKTLDALVLSPGVPLTHPAPHWTVVKAKAAGIEIIGDTEVFLRDVAKSDAKVVAITGTNGKSTTTALIGHVLKHSGFAVEVGGNIGLAVCNLSEPRPGLIYVLELSSFQIDLTPSLAPDVGVLTNLTPDHLDRHGTMEHYAEVKSRMFQKQTASQVALVCVDDDWCRAIAETKREAKTIAVSVTRDVAGLSAPEGVIKDSTRASQPLDLSQMKSLRGRHNWQNAAMAYGVAQAFDVAIDVVAKAMQSFPGLAHRMQEVGRVGAVPFVNDSKATNADAAEKALASYDNIYWIAGGIAKSGGIESLAPYFDRITRAYLIGVAAQDFAKVLGDKVAHVEVETLDRAVEAAARDAAADVSGQAVVLFSPACASFDQYKNFEVRGDAFVSLVSKLPGAQMAQIGDKSC
jgi:UDP-N-acetylmuramoylalanine--D-glutamate ligase